MKKIYSLLVILILATSLSASAQTSVIDRFFSKYESNDDFTVIKITPKMFSMFSKLNSSDPDAKKILNVASKLKGLRILVKEQAKDGKVLFREASQFFTKEFEELMTIREKDNDLKFLIKENGKGNISELIMLVGGSDTFVALSLIGDLNLQELSAIADDMNIEGFSNIKKAKK
ncbi:uncharacterized protein DUF4252 [Chitinophaga skermanii]|uniref:Uncharacterized protein DUF4252 n=1 Tax=Chitinophaga skermanii TaxID=331697 RepID=A0A327QS55_9BACT|nr:DUF4252 domain-containing protein [Chitinophaga skermanii]RAJ06788.1 uncharacterized protein DUF4252 [Chitinophaga skermanii]